MTKLQVLKPLKYGGKQLKAGEVFECENRFVTALCVVGKAEVYIEPEPEPQKRQYRRRNSTSRRSNTYQTRQLTAED